MRICQIITRLIVGGAQENTLLTCEGLHDRGHDVLLLAGPDAGPEGTLWERARNYGYRVGIIESLHRAIRPLADWQALRQLRRIYREFQPEIIHTHSSKAGIIGREAARGWPGAVIHTIHGMSFNRTQPLLVRAIYRVLERRAARVSQRIISVAQAMTTQAVAAGIAERGKFVTIYSGMQTDWFTADPQQRLQRRADWSIPPEGIVVGTVARLFRNKGYEQLIPAMVRAAAVDPRLYFVWVGDGAQRAEYEQQLRQHRLRERVHLVGLVPPQEVGSYMQGFDLLVHASQWEGLPRALPQALLMNIPVISFDNDGAPEVVVDGVTGGLIPFNHIEALAQAILELAADGPRRAAMGTAGHERCRKQFDSQNMVTKIEQVYQEALNIRK
ncbi:MAG: D-inositol-3-phosphate glycosyltransferase [Phycisphaerae bacterium]|nr:D-inositol-3-phosphate glycosyltransferase [Phycisphaerae bacterium]